MDIPFLLLDGILSELQEKPRRKDELQKKVHRRICVRDITFLSDIFIISQIRSKEWNSFFACRYISKLLQVGLSFLVKVARHVQGTQNRKFIKFLLYIKKNYRNCFCVQLWSNIQILYEVPVIFVLTCFWVVVVKIGPWPFRSWNSKISYISRVNWWNELIFLHVVTKLGKLKLI